MQQQDEVGKYVTDGTHTYPYNQFLDELLNNGKLKFCDRPDPSTRVAAPAPPKRSPVTMTIEERTATAERLGVTLGELTNMTPQELAAAEAEAAIPQTEGFPK